MVKAIIRLYQIEFKFMDLKKDLLVILVTNLVLTGETYFLIFNLFSISEQDNLLKLQNLLLESNVI